MITNSALLYAESLPVTQIRLPMKKDSAWVLKIQMEIGVVFNE